MANNSSYKDYILEQLSSLDGVTSRSMFGGVGLYLQGRFFGIVEDDSVFFKTDETTKQRYIKFGMKPFTPSPEQVLKNYYEVPPNVIESVDDLKLWAVEASNR